MKALKFIAFMSLFTLVGCGGGEDSNDIDADADTADLIEIKDGMYTEYYPGKKIIRIQGEQTPDGKREGRWTYFNEGGKEMSYTFFKEGKKNGFSYNSYPNGSPFYYGEYFDDKMIGVWKTYDEQGKIIEKDYGYPDEY